MIISRKITGGRSISRMNGEVCTAAQVREAALLLLDLHGQHEHQSLLYREKQLEILDAFGKESLQQEKAAVKEAFTVWQKLHRELTESSRDEEQRRRETAFLEFEINEIQEANPVCGEDERLEQEYRKMSGSRRILENLSQVQERAGYETEGGAGAQIGRAVQELSGWCSWMISWDSCPPTLTDIDSLLNDFNRELSGYMSGLDFPEEAFYETEQRLNVLNHLKSRYGATIRQVLEYAGEKTEGTGAALQLRSLEKGTGRKNGRR